MKEWGRESGQKEMLIDQHVSIVDDEGCSSEKLCKTPLRVIPGGAEKLNYLSSYLNCSFMRVPMRLELSGASELSIFGG